MKHLIRKQVITLQLDAVQNAYSIQQQARDYYYQQIAPALEKLFDELSSENEIIQIDRFEIDLGELGWKNDRFTLDKDGIYRILKDSFGNSISVLTRSIDSHVLLSYKTPEENACLQWLFYLEKGVLPWQVQTTDAKWLDQVIHQLAIDLVLIERTRNLITRDPRFLARLVREHDEIFLQQLSEVITAKRQNDVKDSVNALSKPDNGISSESHPTKKEIWGQVLKEFAAGKNDIDFREISLVKKKTYSESIGHLNQETIEEGIFCKNAGLVLLHPYFKHLFKHLSLLEEGVFKNTASLEKAVVLLFFIATGKTEAMDYELIIPKIFCGMPLNEVISDESFFLTETEQEEALSMMRAGIEQWEKMRNTSVDGLRETFLEREGKLMIKEGCIELKIEVRGFDLLLDSLPWNLSLVQFPWLQKLIHVEWR